MFKWNFASGLVHTSAVFVLMAKLDWTGDLSSFCDADRHHLCFIAYPALACA